MKRGCILITQNISMDRSLSAGIIKMCRLYRPSLFKAESGGYTIV